MYNARKKLPKRGKGRRGLAGQDSHERTTRVVIAVTHKWSFGRERVEAVSSDPH
jgi:hypothetical protein